MGTRDAESGPAVDAGTTGPLIEAQGVTVRAGARTLLDRVDIAVRPREIVTLIGLNGSGKTTLVRALLGLRPIDAGTVTRRPGIAIGYAPQHLDIDPTLPLTVRRFLAMHRRADAATMAAALAEVGIAPLIDSQLATLSGGERRRAVIARALLGAPDLLVLDEPMSGIDIAAQADLYGLLKRVRDRRGCGILLVSHDLHLVMAATDIVVCLNHHVCCTGHAEAVVDHPGFTALFGDRFGRALAVYRHDHDHRHDAAGNPLPPPGPAP